MTDTEKIFWDTEAYGGRGAEFRAIGPSGHSPLLTDHITMLNNRIDELEKRIEAWANSHFHPTAHGPTGIPMTALMKIPEPEVEPPKPEPPKFDFVEELKKL